MYCYCCCRTSLIVTSATGRAECLLGAGEFRATIFGEIVQLPTGHIGDWRLDDSDCITLRSPDWSPLGWSSDYFAEYHEVQLAVLRSYQSMQVPMEPVIPVS
jgi:hypothetical protein